MKPGSLLPLLLLSGLVATAGSAQVDPTDKPAKPAAVAVPLTAEQKAALRSIDVRLAGLEALLARIDDPAYRARETKAAADLKRRRAGLERNFDPMTSESLMHSIISRYQVIALWLTPPREPVPAARPRANK